MKIMYDQSTCRLCLSTEGILEEIFSSPNLVQKVFECTNIEVKNRRGLPTCICEICKSEIVIWSKFKKQCLETDSILKNKYPHLFVEGTEKSELALETGEDSEIPKVAVQVDDESPKETENYSEEHENVEYIEDDDFDNSYENEDYGEPEENRKMKLIDVKFEAVEEDELAKEMENENDNENTFEIIPVEDEECSETDVDGTKSSEEVTKIGQKAKSKSREVWKTTNGNRIKYHTRCQICGKLQQNIRQHMRIHTNEMPYQCQYCKRGFKQRSNYKHHVYIHTGEKPYKCKLCEKAFSDPASLRSHMILHTGERRYGCEVCGKAFGHSHTLTAHKRIHTQDRRHCCEHCSKKFLSRHALKKHIRTHTGERPYQCDQCPKNFTTSGNLSTHKRVHTKERPYQCNVCGLDFAYKCVLNTHMKRHEEKSDESKDVEDEVVFKIEIDTFQS